MPPNDDNPAQPVTMQNMPLPETFAAGKSQYDVDKWPKWIKRFERYRVATGLSSKPDTEQVSTLLYAWENVQMTFLAHSQTLTKQKQPTRK